MSAARGHVGLVWAIPIPGAVQLVTKTSTLANAEPYGDNLTHGNGHYDTWSGWQRLGTRGLATYGLPAAIAWHEYEDFPRGRVVFSMPDSLFTVYADRQLLSPAIQTRILAAFYLPPDATEWRTDQHYQSTERIAP